MSEVDRELVIEASAISKVYWDGVRKLQVLRDISLTVKKGESVAVLGPSGSGKTTLLNLLSGLDRPSAGSVKLEGQDLHGLPERERARFRNERIGFVFQFYHLLPEFTALENVMLPAMMAAKPKSRPEIEKKAGSLLKRVGLAERSTHYPSELSGGEQQRVALARALVNEPSIVFCDEPTGNLDPATALEVAALIKELSALEKKTVLIVTHDARVAGIATKVVELK
jgi:ABC-type lipoprotein export system ATPase subunit